MSEEKQIFNFTVKENDRRKNLSVDEMTNNLKKLLCEAEVRDTVSGEKHHMLVNRRVSHKFKEKNGVENWYTGKVISQVPK